MTSHADELPFTLRELREAIPARCFRPSTARSLLHLGVDGALLAGLYALSLALGPGPWSVPIAVLQGTLFWALVLVGHDCGHGAFSRRPGWNEWVGHLVHTPLLVPYHAWRLSHRSHHRHTQDADRDEAWPPLSRRALRALPALSRFMRLRAFLLVFPLYLLRNGPGRAGSHFDPEGPLFAESGRAGVRKSVTACVAMAAALLGAGFVFGPGAVARHWLAPYTVFAVWVSLVTYLQHTAPDVPWYRGEGWSYLRGALATVDRRYGPFERLHHDVGSHAVHHLFPRIPHYRLREATRAVAPLLGPHHRVSREPVLLALLRAARRCQAIPETGERVCYEPLSPARAEVPAAAIFAAPPSGAGSSPATR